MLCQPGTWVLGHRLIEFQPNATSTSVMICICREVGRGSLLPVDAYRLFLRHLRDAIVSLPPLSNRGSLGFADVSRRSRNN